MKTTQEQKRKERFDTKQKRLAEEDMKNSPFAQEIEAEEKAEKKAGKLFSFESTFIRITQRVKFNEKAFKQCG